MSSARPTSAGAPSPRATRVIVIAAVTPMVPAAGAWALGFHGHPHRAAYAWIIAVAYVTFGLGSVWFLSRILAKRARRWMRAALIVSVVAELVTLAAIAEFPG